MRTFPVFFLFSISLCGCVSITPQAESVQIHRQESAILATCKKLGPVSAVYDYPFSIQQALATAEVKLRQDAYDMHGDSVVILNSDAGISRVSMQGVAYKCYNL